jgi:late competence protein required for DNA uptake (superfamily II DNA/RNA helicase)
MPKTGVSWKARCQRCVTRHSEDAEALARWKRQVLCRFCLTLRVGSERCEGCELRPELKEKSDAIADERRRKMVDVAESVLLPW